MMEDLIDDILLRDERNDPHRSGTVGTLERVDLEHFSQQLSPASLRFPERKVLAFCESDRLLGGGSLTSQFLPGATHPVGVLTIEVRHHLALVGNVSHEPSEEFRLGPASRYQPCVPRFVVLATEAPA